MIQLKSLLKHTNRAIKLWACLVLCISILTPAIAARASSGIALKQTAVIEGNIIHLGDVFEGLSAKSDKVLGAAPLPGKNMVLNARTLLRIALATDLPWRPGTSSDQIVIRRAATIIPETDIANGIKDALADKGLSGNYTLTFSNGSPTIMLPPRTAESFDIKSLEIKGAQNRFDAVLVAPSLDNPLKTLHLSGMMDRVLKVPVLKDTIRSGSVIGVNDIDFIELKETALNNATITSLEDIVGMTPRRAISSGRIIQTHDLETPKIVERGGIITMTYNNGLLTLTSQGKALQDGAKGDTIRISNVSSGKTIQGIVTGDGRVAVKTF